MSKITNSEDRLRAFLQDAAGLRGGGFDLLLLARHMLDSAELPSKQAENAAGDGHSGKIMAFPDHIDGSDTASMAAQGSDHSDGAAAISNEMRGAAFGKIATSALQTNGMQLSPHVLDALLQLEKLPAEWVLKSGEAKEGSGVTHLNAYAPQSSEVVQLHDWFTAVATGQPAFVNHDDRSTVSAVTASGSSAPAPHHLDSGDAGHNAASSDLGGGGPDLTSIAGSTRDLSAASPCGTTASSGHVFQGGTSFQPNNIASAQLSGSNHLSTATDGAGTGTLSVGPESSGQGGFGSTSGSSLGTSAAHQQMTTSDALSVVAGNLASSGIQSSVVLSDSTNIPTAYQAASADAVSLPFQELGSPATSSPVLAGAANRQSPPAALSSPEMLGSSLSGISITGSTGTAAHGTSLTANSTSGQTGSLSSQATSPSVVMTSSGQALISVPDYGASLNSGVNPDSSQTTGRPSAGPARPVGRRRAAPDRQPAGSHRDRHGPRRGPGNAGRPKSRRDVAL